MRTILNATEDSNGNVIVRLLLPRPTDNPNDPLVRFDILYTIEDAVIDVIFITDMVSSVEISHHGLRQLLYLSVLLHNQLSQSDSSESGD